MSIFDRIRTGDQLDAMHFDPLSWAVHGLIPEGFGLLTGPPKAGKSWAVLDIALAVAGGMLALGKIDTGGPRPVLHFALEDGERRMQGRCRHLLGEGVPIPAAFSYIVGAASANEVLDGMSEWLEEYGDRAPLIVIDTLGKIMPPGRPGESAYGQDYRVGSRLKATVDAHPGSTLLVVHHTRKAVSEDWMDSTSGTNGLNGAADFTVNLSRARNDDAGIVRVTGRDVAEGEYAVTSRQGRWEIDGAELADAARKAAEERATAGLSDRSAEIIAFVNQQAGPVSAKTVADELNIPEARRYLARLAAGDRLQRVGRGLYTPVPTIPVSQEEEGVSTGDTQSPPSPMGQRDSGDTHTGGCETDPKACSNFNCKAFRACMQRPERAAS